ncbi:MAG: hypothetical protein AAFX99_32930, partial [Myxococcota bacterium]
MCWIALSASVTAPNSLDDALKDRENPILVGPCKFGDGTGPRGGVGGHDEGVGDGVEHGEIAGRVTYGGGPVKAQTQMAGGQAGGGALVDALTGEGVSGIAVGDPVI